jgi:hypothetical protein
MRDSTLKGSVEKKWKNARSASFHSTNNEKVKVCVDFILMPDDMTSLFSAYVDVCFKKGNEHVPLKVFSFDLENGYEYDLSRSDEFHHDNFVALTAALGIAGQEVGEDPAPLMAMFLSRVLDDPRAEEIYEDVVGNSHRGHHIRLFHDVFKAMLPHRAEAIYKETMLETTIEEAVLA